MSRFRYLIETIRARWRRQLGNVTMADGDRIRAEKEQAIREGLHEQASRLHWLEIEAKVRSLPHRRTTDPHDD